MFGRDFRAGAKAGGLGFGGLAPPVFHLAAAGIFTLSGSDFMTQVADVMNWVPAGIFFLGSPWVPASGGRTLGDTGC